MSLKRSNLAAGIILFFFLPPGSIFPGSLEHSIKGVLLPSTAAARRQVAPMITGTPREADSLLPDVFFDEINERIINFFIKRESDETHFYFSLSKGLDFSQVKRGSCEIIRKTVQPEESGITEIRFYVKDRIDSFVSITSGKRESESLLSITLYGYVMQQNIKVPLSLNQLAEEPFSVVRERTSGYVNWGFYLPDPDFIYSDDVRALSSRILPLLDFLHDADDGAMNSEGRYVFIDTLKLQADDGGLNCSGFAKWVVDGLYYSKKNTYMSINDLKRKYTGLRGNKWSNKLEEQYDPFFGLDWTRNIAYLYARTDNPDVEYDSVNVTGLSFSSYVKDVGYPLKDLKTVLYELAVTKPQYFYLGSVNMITDDPPGLRKHLHVVVIFPYINSSGDFVNLVFSRNKVITLKELAAEYPGAYIHLVKIKSDSTFIPPGIKFDPTLRRLF